MRSAVHVTQAISLQTDDAAARRCGSTTERQLASYCRSFADKSCRFVITVAAIDLLGV